jgi:hypothetical protein
MFFYFLLFFYDSVYEFYGEDFELGVISPTKCIPIPRTIMNKYKNEKGKNVSTSLF